ncbi:MAG TPA: TraR/DksA family transcriptional regulator, partial [Thermodesulfobacteriota bacterium]|nr:TraR/DksA family transcriptional regulator [Thermodesulfobacteriota bacterium]
TERQRELTLMLGDREREKLREIDKALERLNEEDYGVCEECGEPIGEERLRALPFTRVCVDCKSKSEKETFVKVKVEEEPVIGMLEKAEPEEEF